MNSDCLHRTVSILTGLVLCVLPLAAPATDLLIWPDQLKADLTPVDGQTTSSLLVQNPDSLFVIQGMSLKTTWFAWAPVDLPVGTVIQSACYFTGSGLSGSSSCGLYRARMNHSSLTIFYGTTNTASGVMVPMTMMNPSTIKAGSRYYVFVSAPYGVHIKGVKITY